MNRIAPQAPADESASPFNRQHEERGAAPAEPPSFEAPPLLSDSLADSHSDLVETALDEALEETFAPGTRKPRHDGWTPEAVAGFLRQLAASGVVDHAARAVGMSVAAAYAFRNRRQGRAFAKMWDAMLIHRARARVASELQGRAIAGCVSVRKRDGVVVGEYHYYDNRLAMSLLTRLDRLAEREAASEAQLRALSEDLDDYIDCIAAGGDADAFVEKRRPTEPEPTPAPAPPPDSDPELTTFARLAGCPDYRDVDPRDIEVRDLDLSMRSDWTPDQWVRAFRSGFMTWVEIDKDKPGFDPGPGTALAYYFCREGARLAAEEEPGAADEGEPEEAPEIDTADLDTATIWDWTTTSSSAPRAAASCSVFRLNSGEIWRRKTNSRRTRNDRLSAILNFLNLFGDAPRGQSLFARNNEASRHRA